MCNDTKKKNNNTTYIYFFVSYKDGTSETVKTTCTKAIKMLQEIDLKKSKAKYAAIIRETRKVF